MADGRMHVATRGAGDGVLLLPGFAQTWWQWREVMSALEAAGHRSIAPDLRGEGWTELPFADLTRTRRAQDVIELLDALELERVKLVSHDLGSITAFQLALDFPDRFSAQVMISVPPPQMKFSVDMLPGMRHLWHQEVVALPGIGPALLRRKRLSRHLFEHHSRHVLDPEVIGLAAALLRDPELSRAASLLCRRMVLPELSRIIRGAYRRERFAMPSLFIFGAEDLGFPAHVTREVFADPHIFGADTRFSLVEGGGHYVLDEEPDVTVRLIVDFLDSI
ncbi:alpha/beta fold hydrolase [Mycetocola manganoxydans]|uniref:alpha/beta fold hydrolase n=1 Tax=Mycetocola manganoxydans TaxID=699879 RepID=UPI0015FEEFE8|nr:alpha/beta hydrolase [Mycetocola manganoxydans]